MPQPKEATTPETSTELTEDEAASQIGDLFAKFADKTSTDEKAPKSKAPVEDEENEADPDAEETEGSESDAEESDEDEEQSEEADDSDEGEKPAKKFTVKVDGKDEEVDEDELKKGYSRNQDYTRKTQALAAERKKWESEEITAVRAERQIYARDLKVLEEYLTSLNAKPNWEELRATLSPDEFAARHADYLIAEERAGKVKAERERVEGLEREEGTKAAKARAEAEFEALLTAKPEWRKPETRKEAHKTLVKAAEGLGYTEQDVNAVADHRLWLLLDKVAQFDAQQVASAKAKDKIRNVETGTKPASSAPKQRVSDYDKAKTKFKKTGSIEDAADALSFLREPSKRRTR